MDELKQLIIEVGKDLNYRIELSVVYSWPDGEDYDWLGSLNWDRDMDGNFRCLYHIRKSSLNSERKLKITDRGYDNYIVVLNYYEQLFSFIGVSPIPRLESSCLPQYLPDVGSLMFRNVAVKIRVVIPVEHLCVERCYYCGPKRKDSCRVYDGEFLLEQVLELIGSLNSVVARNSNTKSARNI